MKYKACPICNGKIKKAFDKHNYVEKYTYCKCLNCKHLFINPQPTQKQLDSYYNGLYSVEPVQEVKVRKKARHIIQILNAKGIMGGRVLDVGCSYGYASDEFKKAGFDVEGVELSTKTAKYASQTYNMKVFKEITQTKGKYDLIIMLDVVEHVLNVHEVLKQIQAKLKKGGLYIVTTPNTNSVEYKLYGKLWEWVSPPAHTHLFNVRNWNMTMQTYQMKKLYLRSWKGDSAGNSLFHLFLTLRYIAANTVYAVLPKSFAKKLHSNVTSQIRSSANVKRKEFTGFMGMLHTISQFFEPLFIPLQKKWGASFIAIYKKDE